MSKVFDLENRLKRVTTTDINERLCDSSYYFYDNKVEVGKEVIQSFCSDEKRTNHVILAASMQCGKTAVMNAICNILSLSMIDKDLNIKKYIFATGMNDVQLKHQTMTRAFQQIIGADEENVCFDLSKATKKSKYFFLKNSDLLKGKLSLKNSLLMMDEVQYGSNEKNNLTKFLINNGVDWKDKQSLSGNNTYIVSVSATPFNEMVSDTLNVKKIINIKKDSNYVGVTEFLKNDMIMEASNDDVQNGSIFYYIDEAYNRMIKETQGCGIIFIRTRDFNRIKETLTVRERFDIIELYASGSCIDYSLINDAIEKMVGKYEYLQSRNNTKNKVKPIIVLIKGAFRAGVTIPTRHKDYVYMVYDYSVNAETTAQALLGRMCGYRDISNNNWKRTLFYVNKNLSEQYSNWEQDYSNKSNIPCEKMKYMTVDKGYNGGKTEVFSQSCGNVEIPLSDNEILAYYSKAKSKSTNNLCKEIESLFKETLINHNLSDKIVYDYIGEAHLSGKNNYARSSQIKRFESFTDSSSVFKFRPEKIKDFVDKNNRDYLTEDDLGTRAVYLVLDSNIVLQDNGNIVISGNKRLLVYYVEVSLRTKVSDRKSLFKIHKCTDLKRK